MNVKIFSGAITLGVLIFTIYTQFFNWHPPAEVTTANTNNRDQYELALTTLTKTSSDLESSLIRIKEITSENLQISGYSSNTVQLFIESAESYIEVTNELIKLLQNLVREYNRLLAAGEAGEKSRYNEIESEILDLESERSILTKKYENLESEVYGMLNELRTW